MGVERMDCRNWDEDAYRESILREREALTRTIFRATFAPNANPNPNSGHVATASSDGSIASYSISSCLACGCGTARGEKNWLTAEPDFLTQGHDGPAYDVRFYGEGDDSLLLSCGDDGRVIGWKWKEIIGSETPTEGKKVFMALLNSINKSRRNFVNKTFYPLAFYLLPSIQYGRISAIGPWGALSPIPENNALAVDCQGSIYAAAGDSRAYCWDVEKGVVKTVFKGHSNYLHCIAACKLSKQIITGSEDGTARIWDCTAGKCIQIIDPIPDKIANTSYPCVSCIAVDSSESWLACGKGQSLSIWNLPARECVFSVTTQACVQDVLFDNNQILAVGAEPLLTRFNINGEILSQIQCAPQSVFSISSHPSGVTAVSGYGALVDIISQFGSHSCTFRCRSI
ncbi:hypothetical protein F511_10244 [Dorcoceras hygrometricum]|uniref:Uncharacterized protein n=1 Tax=Dorcoceras hygrometricum TaxID=472368 RepID=A0A2Z7D4T4_9LAMI|nr:hypothetical protein F511_10244 [Dorcoceras hygrometricum]